jgi:hypothetical protein
MRLPEPKNERELGEDEREFAERLNGVRTAEKMKSRALI